MDCEFFTVRREEKERKGGKEGQSLDNIRANFVIWNSFAIFNNIFVII